MSQARISLAEGRRTGPAALVIHSWWGLTSSFLDIARALNAQGVSVMLADLFDGRTATTPQQARALRAAPRREPIYRGLLRDLETLQHSTGAREVAVIGFSMGAHWASWLAQQRGLPVTAAVLYYGLRAGDFTGSRARFLSHFAQADPWVSAAARKRMARALTAAGRPYVSYDYPGTGHWFAESARTDAFDAQAARIALSRTVAFLAQSGIAAQ